MARLGGLKFRRQHPLGPYFLDLYNHKFSIAIEVDGASHDHSEAQQYDDRRDRYLRARGIKVLRFTGKEVRRSLGSVLEHIYLEATGRRFEWSAHRFKESD